MENVLWISRHQPTQAQLDHIADQGQQIVALEEGIEIGSFNLTEFSDNAEVYSRIQGLAREHNAIAVYGVFPAPVQSLLTRSVAYTVDITQNMYTNLDGWAEIAHVAIPCYSAFNVARSVEGGKPTFEHKGFYIVGALEI